MTEQTVKCPIYGKPYKIYTYSAADQSACPACVIASEEAVYRPETITEKRKRQAFFLLNSKKRRGRNERSYAQSQRKSQHRATARNTAPIVE